MQELWSYEKQQLFDRNGNRWHFVTRYFFAKKGDDEPREIYFRDTDRKQFGMIRFERYGDNPYRDYTTLVNKIMNNKEFRESLIDVETKSVWKKNWK